MWGVNQSRSRAVLLLGGGIIIVVAMMLLLIAPSAGHGKFKPSIVWQQASVDVAVAPNETQDVLVAFTALKNVTDAIVRMDGAISSVASVTPRTFKKIKKGQTTSVTMHIAVPSGTPFGRIEGRLQIFERGHATLAKPLPVRLTIGRLFEDSELNVSMFVLSEFQVDELQSNRPDFLRGKIFMIPGDMPNLSLAVYDNLGVLPVDTWYDTVLRDEEYSVRDSTQQSLRATSVSGFPALEVRSDILGHTYLRTLVVVGNRVYGFETTAPDYVEIPSSYYSMLETVSFE